jgi:hypothetical protein
MHSLCQPTEGTQNFSRRFSLPLDGGGSGRGWGANIRCGAHPPTLSLPRKGGGNELTRRVSHVFYGLKGTTVWRCSPRWSMRSVITSPALRYSRGLRAEPTPGGVPVVTTSPGSSTMNSVT